MKRLILIVALFFIAIPSTGSAQQPVYHPVYNPDPHPRLVKVIVPKLSDTGMQFKFAWNTGLPLFATSDFIPDASFSGFDFHFDYRATPNLSIGGWMGWQSFSSKARGTVTIKNVTITGTRLRNMQIIPVMAHSSYSLAIDDDGDTEVYAGLSAGGYFVESFTEVGVLFNDYTPTTHFGFAPEIGFVTGFANVFLYGEMRWNYLLPAGPLSAQSYLNFNLGLLFL